MIGDERDTRPRPAIAAPTLTEMVAQAREAAASALGRLQCVAAHVASPRGDAASAINAGAINDAVFQLEDAIDRLSELADRDGPWRSIRWRKAAAKEGA